MSTGLSAEHLQAICGVLSSCSKVQEVILFGSRAMGNFKPYSDIDLCLCGESLCFDDIVSLRVKLDKLPLVVNIDLLAENMIQSQALLDHIHARGHTIYKRNSK